MPVKVPVRTTTKMDFTPTNSICLIIFRIFMGGRSIQNRIEENRSMILPVSSI
jgi:hypothetical protein